MVASDNLSGDLDLYFGPPKRAGILAPTSAVRLSISGAAGWGVAVIGRRAVNWPVGGAGRHRSRASAAGVGKVTRTLTLAHAALGYNAFSVSWDDDGGLYAAEAPGLYVDYWKNPGAGGAPSCIYTSTTMTTVDYVHASGSSADIYGFDQNESGVPAIAART